GYEARNTIRRVATYRGLAGWENKFFNRAGNRGRAARGEDVGASVRKPPGVSEGGSLGRGLAVIALAALHLLQDDAVEEHGQFRGPNLQPGRAIPAGCREPKYPRLKSLIPDRPAVLLPGKDLQTVAGPIAENKPVT